MKYSVRDAFQLLKERGIARSKQEVRRWLSEGYIRARAPENRRVGWEIDESALLDFLTRYEKGELKELLGRRRPSVIEEVVRGAPREKRSVVQKTAPVAEPRRVGLFPRPEPTLARIDGEVTALRNQVRELRRELNDLKKVLGFPLLVSEEPEPDGPTNS